MATIIVSLQCMPESFQFEAKRIPLPPGSRVLLGSATTDSVRDAPRLAMPSNGFFSAKHPPVKGGHCIVPLALSANHAELWLKNNQLMLRDLESPFGTFVNGKKLMSEIVLKSGDIISLGYQLPRNEKTPADITDDHLKPVVAKLTYSVASQR